MLTVIITCKNEEHNIEAALKSIQWADEIIVVDSFSTDKTVEIAKKYTDKVWQHEYHSPARQKNWAIPQANNEWILLLDADEQATPELKTEVLSIINQPTDFVGYWIPRRNFFMGQEVKYSGWQNDAVIRLFKRDDCRYDDVQVHEEIETTGKIGRLNEKLLHYTYKDLGHYLEKIRRYTDWSAQDYKAKTPKVRFFHLVIKPLFRFFKHYILKSGFRDGKVGLIISMLSAWTVFLRYVKLYQGEKNQNSKFN